MGNKWLVFKKRMIDRLAQILGNDLEIQFYFGIFIKVRNTIKYNLET